MVDFQSRSKVRRFGYAPAPVRHHLTAERQVCDVKALILFQRPSIKPPHDCRLDVLKEHADRRDWESQLLCHGLRQTCSDIDTLHTPRNATDKTKRQAKLLFHLGMRGASEGDFSYPRGVALTDTGDLVIADTMNNRVQVLNQCGVFKFAFGQQGSNEGQFNQPTGVAVLPSDEIVLADNKNRRIQIFHSDGQFKLSFPTTDAPFSVAGDQDNRIIVGTAAKTIEIYCSDGRFVKKFQPRSPKRSKGVVPVFVCCNDRNEIIVLDPEELMVKYFSNESRFLRQFPLQLTEGGLSVAPSSICTGPKGHVIVGDSLNHAACLYSEQGVLHDQLLGPTNGVGPIQSCCLSPQGHLVVTEFSLTGKHCVKIFRYTECICHLNRPGSSKRRELTKSEEKEILVTYRSDSSSIKNE